jgi:hypothetical protein
MVDINALPGAPQTFLFFVKKVPFESQEQVDLESEFLGIIANRLCSVVKR